MAQRVFHLVSHLALQGDKSVGDASGLLRVLPRLLDGPLEHHVVVLRPSRAGVEALAAEGVTCHELNARWSIDPLAWRRLKRLLKAGGQVHLWDEPVATWALQPGHRFPTPPLLTLRTPQPLPGTLARRARRQQATWLASSATSYARAIEAGLSEARGALIPQGALGPPAELPPRDRVLAEWQLPADAMLIATCGTLSHERRLKELIWAADMVRVLHPRTRLVLVGDGPAHSGLEYFARTAAEPENIVLAGSRDAAALLPHCRIYWDGSQWGDSAGAVLDAMACGVPVVASDVPLHREWITPGVDGLLVGHTARADRTRVTDQLITDDAFHTAIASAARRRASAEHSLAAEVDSLVDQYRRRGSPVRA